MNCAKAEQWLSRRLDSELPARRARQLRAHLEGCGACRARERNWSALRVALQERPVPAGPTPQATWADVSRALRREQAHEGAWAPEWSLGSSVRWAAASIAVMVVCIAVGLGIRYAGTRTAAGVEAAEVEWVESDLPDAVSMVYQDADTGWTVIWVMPREEGTGDDAG